MTSASELFNNRRSRFGRNDVVQLGFHSSASSPRTSNHINRRNRRNSNSNHPARPSEFETSWPDQSSHSLPSNTTPDRLTLSSNDSRLPDSVLLARERLFERLRGASLSGSSNHTASNINHNDHVIDDDLSFAEARDWVLTFTRGHAAQRNQFPEQQTSKRTPGLSTGALSSLLVEEFNFSDNLDSSQECSICLESFKDRDKLVRLPCGHRFHYSCLVHWAKICGCCPYCRTNIII